MKTRQFLNQMFIVNADTEYKNVDDKFCFHPNFFKKCDYFDNYAAKKEKNFDIKPR